MDNTEVLSNPEPNKRFPMASTSIPPSGTTKFPRKVATSPPNELPSEVMKAIKTLTDFMAQHPVDQFTSDVKSAETEAAKAVEREIAAGKRHWFATPRLFRTMGTPLKNMMESAGRATVRDAAFAGASVALLRNAAIVGTSVATSVRKTPLLAAAPLAVGLYRFISTTLENNKWSYWIKKFGANSHYGDFLSHESTLRAADQSTMLSASRQVGLYTKMVPDGNNVIPAVSRSFFPFSFLR